MASVSPKARMMEEREPFTVRVAVNGKTEFRIVDKVEIGKWDFPRLVPRLYPGETLVETLAGYEVLKVWG